MSQFELPKTYDEFVDARKNGFLRVKDYKENGGKIVGCLCSYTPQELIYAAGAVAAFVVGLLAVGLLRLIARKGNFRGFAYYCWVVGALTIILSLIF